MSIENSLERIATSLENLENHLAGKSDAKPAKKTTSKKASASTETKAPAPTETKAPAPTETKAPAPEEPIVKTAEELNELLKQEFSRLGSADPIFESLNKFGAASVHDVPVEKYNELIKTVRALQPE